VTEIGVLIRLKLPEGMTPEQGRAEAARGVEFGQPEVILMYVREDPPDAQP
jgi:hypothetical protein